MKKITFPTFNSKSYGLDNSIKIINEKVIWPWEIEKSLYSNLLLNNNSALIDFDDCGSFYVSNGKEIKYNFINKSLSFSDYFHSFVTGLLLLQREHLLLHGNSCIYNNTHIAFCGESGTGKSSLSSQFFNNGALFVCDEIICFEKFSKKILPGYPFIRLWQNDIKFNNFNSTLVSKLWDNEEKYKLDVGSQKFELNHDLNVLVYIEIDKNLSKPKITKIKGSEKFKFFQNCLYHLPIIKALNLLNKFNAQSLPLLNDLAVFKLSRPNNKESRSACFELVKNVLE